MTDAEIGRRFRKIVKDVGYNPWYHSRVLRQVYMIWPLMGKLVKEVLYERK